MKQRLIFILFLISNVGFAQKEANIWYFGENAGLDFNSGNPVALSDGQLNTIEGCATIADANGNLLFYTDGILVWNKTHQVMSNGSDLNGDESSTNAALIIPKPLDNNIYYIITLDERGYSKGLQYSEVDMSLNSSLGNVTSNKNILLETPVAEKITAVKVKGEDAYWVVAHKWRSNEFITYKVTSTGISTTPIVSAVGSYMGGFTTNAIGAMKISPDGTKLALANLGEWESQLFDFDNQTGIISNPLTIFTSTTESAVYGIEFSPNSKNLYVSVSQKGTYQFDLTGTHTEIVSSKTQIGNLNISNKALQLGPDGKIYVAKNGSNYLDIISKPNVLGTACNYLTNGMFLDGKKSESGLPPFIQSFFNITIQVDNTCFGDITEFKPNLSEAYDSISWDFGDSSTSTNENPTHLYANTGDFIVTLIVTSGGQTSTEINTITIYKQPIANQPPNILVCDDNNDGFHNFDLTLQDFNILNSQNASDFDISYYGSMIDYNAGTAITNASIYTNSDAYTSQTIVASIKNVKNNFCEATTTFNIELFESPTPNQNVPELTFCDNTSVGTDSDGLILIDLTQNETIILNGQSTSDFTVNYYRDSGLTNQIISPATYQNITPLETIFVEVVSKKNINCTVETTFDIKVFELPIISQIVELKQCDDDLDGFSTFNLTEVYAKLSGNVLNETITFYESQLDAENGNDVISNETIYSNQTVSTDIVWARIENINSCHKIAQVSLIVSTTQISNTYTKNFYQCDNGIDITDGLATFNLSSVDAEIQAMFPLGQQLLIKYYRNQTDALSEINPISNISNYQNIGYPNSQDIFIRVDSALDNNCLGLGHHISLYVETVPKAYAVNIAEQCDDNGDGMYAFDTSNIETILLNGQNSVDVTYVDTNRNLLSSPLPNPFLTTTQTITARVTNSNSQDPNGACYDETTITFTVDAAAVAYSVNDFVECDDDNDGLFPFDTSLIETTVLNGQTDMIVSYLDENGDSLTSPLPNPFITSTQTITVKVENPLSNICYEITTVEFVVVDKPELLMDDTWLICENDVVEIIADGGYGKYLWSTGEISETIEVSEVGNYEVTVTNVFNSVRCSTKKNITVIASGTAKIMDIQTRDWTRSSNGVTVFVEGTGNYEYSLDGIEYQASNEFKNLIIDDYTIYIRDKNGCGIVTEDLYLMYYPHFFTPNGDGNNDTWQIINSDKEPLNKIYIYDRYGKLLKQLNPSDIGWDGTFNGRPLSTNDYWFVLERENGEIHKGHFALKI